MPAGGAGSGFTIRPDDLHSSGSTLGSFGDSLTQGGQKLQTIGQDLVSHASKDKSGVGSIIAKAMGSGTEVAGKVFSEGGRVAGAAGSRLHSSADNHLANETEQHNKFTSIKDPEKDSHDAHDSGSIGGKSSSSSGSGPSNKNDKLPEPKSSSDNRPDDPKDTGTGVGNRNCLTDPVDVATGEVVLAELDLELPGPLPLRIERTHISGYRAGRRFGGNWASTVDQRLEIDGQGVCYFAPDGMILVYPQPEPGAAVLPEVGPAWPLSVQPDGTYTIESAAGTLWFAGRSGAEVVELDAITDTTGRRVDIERQSEQILLTHSEGYRVALHTAEGLVTELHVLGPDADVLVLRYGYDERGRLSELVNSSGLATRFTYDEAGRLTGWQDRTGVWYRYDYDAEGRCVRTSGQDGFYNGSFDYAPDGRSTTFTNSLSQVSVYRFNELHQTIGETDPLGNTTTYQRDSAHRLLARTDPLGHTTRYEYRADGSLAALVRADGSRVVIAAGPRLSIQVVDGEQVWQRDYAEDERPDPFRDPVGVSTTAALPTSPQRARAGGRGEVERDLFGRPTSLPDATGAPARVGWTIEGKLAWRATPDAREQWRYDPEGNELEHLDASGNARRRQYGPFGLLLSETDPAGASTSYAYDTELRLVGVTNANGQTWSYRYDPAGRLVESVDFDGRRSRFEYDAAGRVLLSVNAAGQATEYGYDTIGNVVRRSTSAGVTTFGYDPVGQLVAATSPDAELAISRDQSGRVLAQTVNGATISFAYDDATNTVRRRTPSGVDSQLSYTEDGRLASIDIDGRRVDPGELAAQAAQLDPGVHYRLDATGRVSEVSSADAVERYRYDAMGNLLTSPLTGDYRYEGTTLVRAGATAYRHDELGRLVQRAQLTESGQRTWDYAWDAQDRLTSARTPDGATWHYRYDPLGRRIGKQRVEPDGSVSERTEFVWDGAVLVEEIRTSAAGRQVTTWAHDEDDRPLAQAENATDHGIKRMYTILTDRVGAPVELRDAQGATAWRARTTLWGAPLPGTGDTFAADTPLRFPGQYHDAETGLHYNVFRYYDPATARYVSQDPLGLAPAANPVTYVANPLVDADPMGLAPCNASTSTSSAPAPPGSHTAPALVPNTGSKKRKSDTAFNNGDLDDDYVQDTAHHYINSGKTKTSSEAMGEAGALAYLRNTGHNPNLGLHNATDQNPHTLLTTPGQSWSHAVAFGGSGVADVSHWDGKTLHVVEAKGGSSQLGGRTQAFFHQPTTGAQAASHMPSTAPQAHINTVAGKNYQPGDPIPQEMTQYGAAPRLGQGTDPYLTDIGHAMANSSKTDGRNLLGQQILDGQAADNVHYVPVRTQAEVDPNANTVGANVTAEPLPKRRKV